MRKSYEKFTLSEEDAGNDPISFFHRWFEIAKQENVEEPNAMHLATVNKEGQPSGRVVLLKSVVDGNFLFFTNYDSRKGKNLSGNPKASLTFFWASLERQVRIEGTVSPVSRQDSIDYFSKRPRVSQLGAYISNQSEIVPNREYLESLYRKYDQEFEGKEIPTPENWGGYSLEPNLIEFWQGRKGRLHDRIQFVLREGRWKRDRLSP
ncbi:pyridoxamine 5'-phosphate oxidase [Leptospira idonii]|uniref:Pyridoxine/pyridoxamine 5'-phosphate oxidase n=2 Tax=Leptospira idonii TaxID=1193500 RepID=A0A4R9M0L6_9LEPT|nr:pyridoxamine 5'-phosphate oxidase [Leptospira idonii]